MTIASIEPEANRRSTSLENSRPGQPALDKAEVRRLALEKKLARQAAKAVMDWQMIADGDHIMVAISGGKDSFVMLRLLQRMQRIAPVEFSLLAFHLDQAHPGFPVEKVEAQIAATNVDYRIVRQDTYSIVKAKLAPGATTCSLCSRLRRGILYTHAEKLGCTKIALGHHRDDLIHTLLLNLFFSGQIKTMAPHLVSDSGQSRVIRPLANCREANIAEYATLIGFDATPCTLCSDQDGLKRTMVSQLLDRLSKAHPGINDSLFASLRNVRPTHILDQGLQRALGVAHWSADTPKLSLPTPPNTAADESSIR